MYHLAEIAEEFNYINRLHHSQITGNQLNFNYNFFYTAFEWFIIVLKNNIS